MKDNAQPALTLSRARRLLWAWDPLGLAPEDFDDEVPADEYDDLVAILLSGDAAGDPVEETVLRIVETFVVDYLGSATVGLEPYMRELLAVLH